MLLAACAKADLDDSAGDEDVRPGPGDVSSDTGQDAADTASADTDRRDAGDTTPADTGDDTGAHDAGTADTGTADTGTDDTGSTDTGSTDTGPDDTGGACGGACTGRQVCDNGQCVDPCVQNGVSCGETDYKGTTVQCGGCSASLTCQLGQCVDVCDAAAATCGEVLWDGQSASCGHCPSGQSCFDNRCAALGYRDIAAGRGHTCATLSNGEAKCWGQNVHGELGDGTTNDALLPRSVATLTSAARVSATKDHSCALTTDGRVACWGINNFGQVGDGSTTSQDQPQSVPGISAAVAVSAGGDHSCAVLGLGNVRCWGSNVQGQLGDGQTSTNPVTTPVTATGLNTAVEVVAGGGHTCARTTAGEVYCWGLNDKGQLGIASIAGGQTSPTQVTLASPATDLAAGLDHTCAATQDGTVYCWGAGTRGQLGNGANSDKISPVLVTNLTKIRRVTAGHYHTCAIDADSDVYCWGRNDKGQLGNGTTTDSNRAVKVTAGLTGIVTVDAGYQHTCATKLDGTAWCWGDNFYGQIGDGTLAERTRPVPVQ